jgi:hypothetical protein
MYFQMRTVERYANLYNATHTLVTERRTPPDETHWPIYEKYPYELSSSYGDVVKTTCSVTFIVMEAKLSYPIYEYGPGQSLWFGLESIGAFAPKDACVVLMTSTCAMKNYLGGNNVDETTVHSEIIHNIYEQSLPLFRRMIESGRVRINFLDQNKLRRYHLTSCSEFSSSNNGLLHHQFWDEEFEERDSDIVVVFEAENSALCYPLLMDHMTKYAYVGSVSPKTSNPFVPDFLEGPCREMPKSWHSWLRPQRKYHLKINHDVDGGDGVVENLDEQNNVMLLREEYPNVCGGKRAPFTSGGLSIRSRRWMMNVIATCPHVQYSGLNVNDNDQFFPCKVFDLVNEGYYFATVLHGLDAPLPSAYVASLFAAEVFWSDQVLDSYPMSPEDNSSPSEGRPTISSVTDEEEMVVPNAVHNVWWYHPDEMLRSEAIARSCPLLPFMYNPRMNRYGEFSTERDTWIGIGT